jgi:hypothetical protein
LRIVPDRRQTLSIEQGQQDRGLQAMVSWYSSTSVREALADLGAERRVSHQLTNTQRIVVVEDA